MSGVSEAPTARQLAANLGLPTTAILGSPDVVARNPGTISGQNTRFAFCKYESDPGAALVRSSRATVVVCPESADDSWRRTDQTLVRSPTPRKTFIQCLPYVVPPRHYRAGIDSTAVVDESATIDPSAHLGAHVYVGARSTIGPNAVLHPHVVLGHDVHIGARTTIFAGAVLGADGFGYERESDGSILKFIHIGGVVVGEDVEIGANTCIDRGALGDTVIEDFARVDNLVHIAHNVRIGKRAFVIALAMIGGSTEIDDDAWIAPGAVLRNGILIGRGSTVGLGAVVTKSVGEGQTVLGNPARSRSDNT
jgi:UDP-3-O-[3-hydroxymyristoyl] glucosamine N-acyltransferase